MQIFAVSFGSAANELADYRTPSPSAVLRVVTSAAQCDEPSSAGLMCDLRAALRHARVEGLGVYERAEDHGHPIRPRLQDDEFWLCNFSKFFKFW